MIVLCNMYGFMIQWENCEHYNIMLTAVLFNEIRILIFLAVVPDSVCVYGLISLLCVSAGTVVKAGSRTVTKSTTAGGGAGGAERDCEDNSGVPNTPRSSIASTPSRRVRPKFR